MPCGLPLIAYILASAIAIYIALKTHVLAVIWPAWHLFFSFVGLYLAFSSVFETRPYFLTKT
ncbi:hypothetical protein CGL51_14145 [Pyrobaculum aerophilum]|uniref:Uncharacterized protein n=1 Tax=Pyrobaculum aerophilum TaxID=13773 RepID=A0A371QUB6_9CREN|nr:hypothetical protein CGL51_14145 [Pyrobaculum aerophilum]